MFFQQIVERRACNPQELGGARQIAVRKGERLPGGLRLRLLTCDAQVQVLRIGVRVMQIQIRGSDDRALGRERPSTSRI